MQHRVKKIFSTIKAPLDAIVIKNASYPFLDENFFYTTGLVHGLFEGSLAVLYPSGEIDLVVSQLEEESARKAKLNVLVYHIDKEYKKIEQQLFSSFQHIGINYAGISHQAFTKITKRFPKLTCVDVSRELQRTRMVKDETEIELIREATKITDMVLDEIPSQILEGMMESELAAEINYRMQKKGADNPAFETISSFGKNTAEPHYSHGDTQLKRGDFILLDFGAQVKKYNSDVTRTFFLGRATEEQKTMYQTVSDAQSIGFDSIKPGVKAREVHNAVSAFIDNTKYKGRFIHSTGHSLGLAVHDGGRFGPESEIILVENMVFTVEPGIYVPGFGGVRIEDDIRVTQSGVEVLTKNSRALLEI